MKLRAEKGIFWALLALLLWAPVPLGSNRGWAWAMMSVWAFGLLGAWLVLWAMERAWTPPPLRRAWPVFALLGGWILLHLLAIVPLPREWVAALSPASHAAWSLPDLLLPPAEAATVSVEPHASLVALLKTLAYVAVFFLFLAVVNNRERVRTVAHVLVYAAVLHALYAVLLHLANVNQPLFGTLINHGGSASGFYPNRNHFAGMLEMTLAIGIGLLIAGLSEGSSRSWRQRMQSLAEWILSPKMVLRISLCVLVIALTTTHSRMGNTGFFAALFLSGVLGIALSRHATRKTVILLASLVVLDLLIVGGWFGVEKLAQRLEATTMVEVREREEPAMYALALVQEFPVLGAGPGTFYVAFTQYRPEAIPVFFDFVHNDYVQIAAESGLLGLALLGMVVVLSLGAAVRAQMERRDPLMRGMAFASFMGVTALLIHSWVDFNLQIPANALLFMVLLALGWISLHLDRAKTNPVHEPGT